MDCNLPALLEIVSQGAFALWALVVLLAVKELRALRQVVEKNGNKEK